MQLLAGKIINGEKVGRDIGFPTANLKIVTPSEDRFELEPGIYTVVTYLPFFNSENCEQLELDNNPHVNLDYHAITAHVLPEARLKEALPADYKTYEITNPEPYPGLLHYGPRSTFNEEELQWEVYLYNFDFVIYGELMLVDIKQRLRGSMKFDSVAELITRMHTDKQDGVDYFNGS